VGIGLRSDANAPGLELPPPGQPAPVDFLQRAAMQREWDERQAWLLGHNPDAAEEFAFLWEPYTIERLPPPDEWTPERHKTAQLRDESRMLFVQLLKDARRIAERKTIFVFPPSNPKAKSRIDALIGTMADELSGMLLDPSMEHDPPWAFVPLMQGASDAFDRFIRGLHGKMFAAKTDVDVSAWRRKGGAILLSGPTGSGKSYVARQLAAGSDSPVVEINLAAITDEQLESRMRGYIGGTFTGANKEGRKGWFEEAKNGVLFFDEFQSVSLSAQIELLDLLSAVSDEITVARVGEDHNRRPYKVKVILAINEDVHELIRAGRLRKDIFFRIRKVERFPSLKDRLANDSNHRYLKALLFSYRWKSARPMEEIADVETGGEDLVEALFPRFTADALAALASHEWPGNFRELERVAFDLYYHTDYMAQSPEFRSANVTHAVDDWDRSACIEDHGAALANTFEQRKMREVSLALLSAGCIVDRAINTDVLKSHKLGSRRSLRDYLKNNHQLLDPEVANDSRIRAFLKLDSSAGEALRRGME
jgi:hypothetical protein